MANSENHLGRTEYWRILRRKITEHFSLGEIKVLCFDAMVDYDEIAGEEKVEKVANLIGFMARRGRLTDLVTLLKEERPNVEWNENVPSPDQQKRDAETMVPSTKDDLILHEYLKRLREFIPEYDQNNLTFDPNQYDTIYDLTLIYMNQIDLWRKSRLVRYISESGLLEAVSLAKVELMGADLAGVNLERANLEGANLENAFLVNSNLAKANLSFANLDFASLQGANLQEADLSNASLKETKLTGADLRNAKFPIGDVNILNGALLNNQTALLYRAESNLLNKNYSLSMDDINTLLELYPANDWFYFIRGLAYKASKNVEKGHEDIHKALATIQKKQQIHPEKTEKSLKITDANAPLDADVTLTLVYRAALDDVSAIKQIPPTITLNLIGFSFIHPKKSMRDTRPGLFGISLINEVFPDGLLARWLRFDTSWETEIM